MLCAYEHFLVKLAAQADKPFQDSIRAVIEGVDTEPKGVAKAGPLKKVARASLTLTLTPTPTLTKPLKMLDASP